MFGLRSFGSSALTLGLPVGVFVWLEMEKWFSHPVNLAGALAAGAVGNLAARLISAAVATATTHAPTVNGDRQAESPPDETAKRLRFVRNVLGIFGFVSLLWFFVCLFMPYYGSTGFGFTMPTLLLSPLTGGLPLNGAWHAMHRQSYGWTLIGNIALLFPVNVPQMMGLFFTIWSSTHLWNDEVRNAFSSEESGPLDAPPRHWLRRVPIPAWIALLLFGMVFVAAIIEWSGQDAASSRANGVVFYLLGTVFVAAWGAISLATKILRGSSEVSSSLPPTRSQLVGVFSVVILLTGVFLWQWAELSNRTDREAILGFLTGQGFIAIELQSADVSVEFNGQPVEVAPDGRVLIRVKQAGSYVYRSFTAGGPSMSGEFLIHAGMGATVELPASVQRVVVTGPMRGDYRDDDSSPLVKLDRTWAEQPPRQPVVCLDVTAAGHRVDGVWHKTTAWKGRPTRAPQNQTLAKVPVLSANLSVSTPSRCSMVTKRFASGMSS